MKFCRTCGRKLMDEERCPVCYQRRMQSQEMWQSYQYYPGQYRTKKKFLPMVIAAVAVLVGIILIIKLATGGKDGIPKFNARNYDETGTCGEDAQWGYKEAAGELTIIGTGEMEDYYYKEAPWRDLAIQSIKIYGVTTIGDYTFYGCEYLRSITIPHGVTSIGEHAFSECTSLESVAIPDSVMTIEEYAFNGCERLKTVTIPDGMTMIDEGVFSDCSSLESITIPDSVRYVGTCAFTSSDNLRNIYYSGTEEQWKSIGSGLYNGKFFRTNVHYNS